MRHRRYHPHSFSALPIHRDLNKRTSAVFLHAVSLNLNCIGMQECKHREVHVTLNFVMQTDYVKYWPKVDENSPKGH